MKQIKAFLYKEGTCYMESTRLAHKCRKLVVHRFLSQILESLTNNNSTTTASKPLVSVLSFLLLYARMD